MTYKAFLEALAKTPREWHVTKDGWIRSRGACPVQAVAHSLLGHTLPLPFLTAEKLLKLPGAHSIIGAADDTEDHNPGVRADLLRACGLE